jgi:hypothetical protein
MKKVIGSVVVAVLLASLGLPFAAAAATSSGHECCLAHGVHHCADSNDATGEPAFSAKCPHHASSMFFGSAIRAVEVFGTQAPFNSSAILHESPVSAVLRVACEPVGRAPPVLL